MPIRDGGANLKKVEVKLPLSLALDPDNAQALCKPEQRVANCPKTSIVGQATAVGAPARSERAGVLRRGRARTPSGPDDPDAAQALDPAVGRRRDDRPRRELQRRLHRPPGHDVRRHPRRADQALPAEDQRRQARHPRRRRASRCVRARQDDRHALHGPERPDQGRRVQAKIAGCKTKPTVKKTTTSKSKKALTVQIGDVGVGRVSLSAGGLLHSVTRTLTSARTTQASITARLSGKTRAALSRRARSR